MPPIQTHSTRHYLLWLGLLVLAVLIFFALRIAFPAALRPMSTQATTDVSAITNAPVPADADHVAAQKGFQYLVSYTDTGFSPAALSLSKGETVRFTNNSSGTLSLMIVSGTPYVIAHGTYIEYTADTTGSFEYSDGTIAGTLTVTE